MNGPAATLLFRVIHIVFGVFWVGGALFLAIFVLPAMRAVGPAGGPVMSQLIQVRRMPLYMMGAAVLTVLSGLGLYWRNSGGLQPAWLHSGTGLVFGLGGLLGLAALGVGMGVSAPVGRRMGALSAGIQARGGPPSPDEAGEMQRLQARMVAAAYWVAALLTLATASMAVARYVR
jgi:hypothetical protein